MDSIDIHEQLAIGIKDRINTFLPIYEAPPHLISTTSIQPHVVIVGYYEGSSALINKWLSVHCNLQSILIRYHNGQLHCLIDKISYEQESDLDDMFKNIKRWFKYPSLIRNKIIRQGIDPKDWYIIEQELSNFIDP